VSLPDVMTRPRAVLFDWDNTLVNTWPTIVECYRDTFNRAGPDTVDRGGSPRPRTWLAARRFSDPVRVARRRGRAGVL